MPREGNGVSVILLHQGTPEQLESALHSVYEQTAQPLQVVVADRTAGQESLNRIATVYGDRDNLLYQQSGPAVMEGAAYNCAVEAAEGKYLAFLESGAVWRKDKLERQLSDLELSGSQAVWAYHAAEEKGGKESIPAASVPLYQKAGHIFPDLIRSNRLIEISTLLMERDIYYELGGMDEELPIWASYELMLRTAERYPVFYSERILASVMPKAYPANLVVAMQTLLLEQFAAPLEQYGLKEEKMEQVMAEAEEKGLFALFCDYAKGLQEDAAYAACLEQYQSRRKGSVPKPEWTKRHIEGLPGCVGCASCVESCPTGAISMLYDGKGFLTPRVDEQKCISCGKCRKVCPVLQELPMQPLPKVCYAVNGPDQVRGGCSSGGVFPVLAKYFLQSGGYVAGAVFDENYNVKHIVSNRPEDMVAMLESKYVQSDTRGVYPRIRELLEQGKKVLFGGCGCQVAGLLAYLSKPYPNLYTVDLVCHGAPAPGVWQQYLEEFKAEAGPIEEVSFRRKSVFGWHTGLYIRFRDGRAYCAPSGSYNPYVAAFLNDLILRDSCYACAYKEARCSDMTLGDFWGISELDKQEPFIDDGKGTSFVTLNTLKGMELYRQVRDSFGSVKRFQLQDAAVYNPSLFHSAHKTELRRLLYDRLPGRTLGEALGGALESQRFDIALVLWWSPNYGNALTNYALYQALAKKYSVLPIDNVCMEPSGRFRRFADSYAKCSSQYFPAGSRETIERMIHKRCDAFIVGSDQTWNVHFEKMVNCGKYFQLDFVGDDKKKLSYAASFGMEGAQPPAEEYGQYYRRFDGISVREGFGVEVCRREYQAEAVQVLDPVFLLESGEYDTLAANAKVKEEEPFIFAYLLNPTPEKRRICKELQRLLHGIKIVNVSENSAELREEYRHILEFDNVKGDIEVEDWIYYMKHCEFVITDSFHGTCFATIYHKRFLTFVNRQPDRFQIFDRFPGAGERIVTDTRDINPAAYLEELDYDAIQQALDREKETSLAWLHEALAQ